MITELYFNIPVPDLEFVISEMLNSGEITTNFPSSDSEKLAVISCWTAWKLQTALGLF